MKNPMVVLMLANTRAAELRAQEMGVERTSAGVLKGAASHSGAFLLQALDEMGWHLAPKDERLARHLGQPLVDRAGYEADMDAFGHTSASRTCSCLGPCMGLEGCPLDGLHECKCELRPGRCNC